MLADHDVADLIRTAVRTEAGHAPDAAAVREGLAHHRAARRRRHRTLGVAAAAAAVIAVAVAAPVLLRPGHTTSAAAPAPSQPQAYAPTWVPPGWVQNARTLHSGTDVTQDIGWMPAHRPAAPLTQTLDLIVGDETSFSTATVDSQHSVDINGAPGTVEVGTFESTAHGTTVREIEARVSWVSATGAPLSIVVDQPTDGSADIVRMARSVVAHPGTRTDIPLVVPARPVPITGVLTVSGTTPDHWAVTGGDTVHATYSARPQTPTVHFSWGPAVTNPLAGLSEVSQVRVQRGVGYYRAPAPLPDQTIDGFTVVPALALQQEVAVRVDGWWLTVDADPTVAKSALLAFADDLRFHPNATFPWLGQP